MNLEEMLQAINEKKEAVALEGVIKWKKRMDKKLPGRITDEEFDKIKIRTKKEADKKKLEFEMELEDLDISACFVGYNEEFSYPFADFAESENGEVLFHLNQIGIAKAFKKNKMYKIGDGRTYKVKVRFPPSHETPIISAYFY